ncbi:TonB-dependent receptor plug domain-containing protein [Sphingobium scionense]
MFRGGRTYAGSIALVIAATMAGPAHAQADADQAEEAETEIVVQATRTGRRVQDEPIRVEVINREEIEEKLLMRPGNIAMLVSETPGIRVQTTSPALGAANVRIQGLKGRYTQILADGLQLYGGQTPSIGLLQIPPTDLGQVEIIKGAASALYGPSALGGVINLVSRRPASEPQGELLLNATSRDGQDLTGYVAAPLSSILSGSLTVSYDRQSRQDLNDDGWADMPGYERFTVRPRLFLDAADGTRALLTFGAMAEQRDGGTMSGANAPDGSPFAQTLRSRRYDLGLTVETPLEGIGTLHLRASGSPSPIAMSSAIRSRRTATTRHLPRRRSAARQARRHGWQALRSSWTTIAPGHSQRSITAMPCPRSSCRASRNWPRG